ncbi:MAG TPA: hypothetical protein PKE39_08575 [Ignavibacteria bacterium]|nr:hypothetical protein [Ignavibacteria bacterium]HMQ99064.1 hypothetical protein [Ignavibacteria bacterium]
MPDTILSLSNTLNGRVVFRPYSNFPPVLRDLSILADTGIKQGDIMQTILSINSGKLLKKVSLYDIYQPKNEAGKISYTYSLEYRADDRTLTSEEVNGIQDKIIAELKKKHKAELRK